MFYFDSDWLLIVGPTLLISAIAAFRVKSTFAKYSRVGSRSGLTGAAVAGEILRANGVHDVRIEPAQGFLSDHYDPRNKVLRLSPDVYNSHSIAAIGVAAHEVGHAIQDASDYAPLRFRSTIVPIASLGSNLSWILVMIGLMMSYAGSRFGMPVFWAGVAFFSVSVVFTLVTLPVEFDASRRALLTIEQGGYLRADEVEGARKVLSAAAMTYVAAAITAIATLLYFLVKAGVLGGRSND